MCGIAGCIVKNKLDNSKIKTTLDLMKRRGPDFQSLKYFEFGDKFLYLFHSRLSIIDLADRSNQPFSSNGFHIIFNGEIYNYIELKHKYLNDVKLLTNSDTEVLLHLFIKFGDKVESLLEGMWSFVIYNDAYNKVYISRDRFGEKPFYYLLNNDEFFFGSEIKFINSLQSQKLQINHDTIKRFLIYGYKSLFKQNQSFYKDIQVLSASNSFSIDTSFKLKFKKYWTPNFERNNFSLNENIEIAKDLLIKSLKLRLRSDVPIAFNLSGGIDSTSLVALANELNIDDINTFSVIDDDERYDESKNINTTVKQFGTNHVSINIKDYLNFESLKEIISYHDQPISTINYFAHSILHSHINKHGYKVSISGTAADELFAGYWDHHLFYLYDTKSNKDFNTSLSNWENYIMPNVENPFLKNSKLFFERGPDFRGHIYLNSSIYESFLNEKFTEEQKDINYITDSYLKNRMMNELFNEITPICLQNEDLNSMFYSIENRSPFLDSNLVNFAFSIPTNFYIKNGYSKYILREAMKGIINEDVRMDRRKRGFNASINSLFEEKKSINHDFLFSDSEIFEILNKEKIKNYLDENNLYENSDKKFIFNFINCKIFLDLL